MTNETELGKKLDLVIKLLGKIATDRAETDTEKAQSLITAGFSDTEVASTLSIEANKVRVYRKRMK